jgi:hypothetical protein
VILDELGYLLFSDETLTGKEIVELLKGHQPVRDTPDDRAPLRSSLVPTITVA